MIIGGFHKFSMIDYPGKLSAVIFTQGCNFKCLYCHNPELLPINEVDGHDCPSTILSFLKKRKNKLDAVVITGGEPTLQSDLPDFLKQIKELGYLIKLDTNGSFPEVIKKVISLELIDYIAMDIKAPFKKYSQVTDSNIQTDKIKESIDIIMNSGIDYEFRTTIDKTLLDKQDIVEIANLVKGAKTMVLQNANVLQNGRMGSFAYQKEEFLEFKSTIEKLVQNCAVR